MLSFTKRERILLMILGAVLVFAGLFYFVFRPLRAGLETLRDDLQVLEEERQDAQLLLNDAEIYETILEQDRVAYEELRK